MVLSTLNWSVSFASMLAMARCSPDANSLVVYNNKATRQYRIRRCGQKTTEGSFSGLSCSRPNSQTNHPGVCADRVHSCISEVLIERDHNGFVPLRPFEGFLIRCAVEPDVSHVADYPVRTLDCKEFG